MAGKPEYLVFVESNTTTGRLFARRAKHYGCTPVVFSKTVEKFAYLAEDKVEARRVDTSSSYTIEQELGVLAKDGVIRGVGTSTDWGILEASLAALSLGLPGPNPDMVSLCRDKAAQRSLLKQKGKDNVHQIVCRTALDCYEAARDIGKPVVVKPISSAGSIGVRYCASPSEALEHANTLLSLPLDMRRKDEFLVEEAISGPQFSLEIFNGTLVGIVRQHYGDLPFFVATGHDFPAHVSPPTLQKLRIFANMLIDEFALKWGPVHAEVRLNQQTDEITLIEINPRLAGAYVPELIRYACGIDLIDLTVRNYLGLVAEPRASREPPSHGVMRFLKLQEADGVVPPEIGVAQLPEFVRESTSYLPAGTKLKRANDYRDRYGHVIAVASAYKDAERAADEVVNRQTTAMRDLCPEAK